VLACPDFRGIGDRDWFFRGEGCICTRGGAVGVSVGVGEGVNVGVGVRVAVGEGVMWE